MSRYAKLGVSAMFMAGVLFMLGVIAAGIAVRLAFEFFDVILGALGVLVAVAAVAIFPRETAGLLVGLALIALLTVGLAKTRNALVAKTRRPLGPAARS